MRTFERTSLTSQAFTLCPISKVERESMTSLTLGETYAFGRQGIVERTIIANGRRYPSTPLRFRQPAELSTLTPAEAYDYAFLRLAESPQPVPSTERRIRIADLFCGSGGLSLGLREACRALQLEFVSVLAADADDSALRVYTDNFKPLRTLSGDIGATLNRRVGSAMSYSEQTLVEDAETIDIVVAGPPCQGHSNLNNHTRRSDDRNRLYDRVVRFVELTRPESVIIENVPSVVYATDRVVDSAMAALRRFGYYVVDMVVELDKLGVPQRRRRHILLASRRNMVDSMFVKHWNVQRPRTVKWAIHDLEDAAAMSLMDTPSELSCENRRRIQYLMRHRLYDLPNAERPACHRDVAHTYKSMYGRLRYSAPAQTITSGFGSPGQGRFIHPTRYRTLTPREAARLQGFPDFFDFGAVARRGNLATMIGNAVPLRLGYLLGLELFA